MPKDTGGSPAVRIEREQDVAFVVIDNPPVNATSLEVRAGLLDAAAKERRKLHLHQGISNKELSS